MGGTGVRVAARPEFTTLEGEPIDLGNLARALDGVRGPYRKAAHRLAKSIRSHFLETVSIFGLLNPESGTRLIREFCGASS